MSDLFDIGVEAYIYGYPLVLMDLTRSASSDRRPSVGYEKEMSGGFTHATCFPDADFKDVVRPNNDTLYSMAWVDLREGPFVLSVEESGERYFLIQMLDMWTDVFASLGTRTTGNGAMRFLLTGPSWDGEVPEGMRPIRSPTTTVWMIARIQTNGEGDIDNVKAMQRGMSLTPVSRSIPGGGACEPSSDAKGPPVEQIMGMDARTFFETFAELMAYNTPHANDYPILHSMERVGIVFEDGGAADGLDGDAWDELGRAVIEGRRRIKAKVDNMGTHKNNWSTWITNIGTYGTDYLARAAIAHFGLGANVREDAIYPITFLDRDGRQLNGGERYVMHFDEDRLPPAKAF